MTRPPLLIAAAALVLVLGSAVPASSEEEAPEKVAIEFSPAALTPEVARVRSGGEVSWVNKATGRNGFVVFPLSIESDFTCHPLAPAFHEIGAGWRSAPITAEGGFSLPCPLKPGKHPYRLHLYDSKRDPKEVGEGEPLGDMRGHIVVIE
jgi:hypothetical protein